MVEVGIQPCEKEFEQVLLAHKRKEDSPYFFCTLIQKGSILVGRTRFFMQAQHYDARSHAAEYPSTQEKNVFCVLYVAKTTYKGTKSTCS